MQLHPAVLPTLERTPSVLRALLDGMPPESTDPPGAEGWSAKNVLAHLLSVHYAANLQRARRIINEDEPEIPDIDEHDVLESSGMRAWPLARLLDEFAAARADAMGWIRAITPDQLTRSGNHAIAGRITASDVLHHVAWHDLLHISQVARLIGAPLDARRGPMGASFPGD